MTRASYALLVAVPLLSGIWPGVRLAVNQYNRSAEEATRRVHEATRQLQIQVDRAIPLTSKSPELGRVLQNTRVTLLQIQQQLRAPTLQSPNLPWSWAAGFFAALCVVLGHAIYESQGPGIVKRHTRQEYVRAQIKDYVDVPTIGKLRYAARVFEQMEGASQDFNVMDEEQRRNLVERAAGYEYVVASRERLIQALAALVLYGAGLLLLLAVLGRQAYRIAQHAGWL